MTSRGGFRDASIRRRVGAWEIGETRAGPFPHFIEVRLALTTSFAISDGGVFFWWTRRGGDARAASAAADRLAEGIRHHVARKRDDAKLMDATDCQSGAASIEVAFDRLMASAAHPTTCRRRTWYTLAKLAPLVSRRPRCLLSKLPGGSDCEKSALAANPDRLRRLESLAKAVACVHAVGSFLRAEVIDEARGRPALWKYVYN